MRKLNEMVLKYDRTFDITIVKTGLTKAAAEQLEHEEIERIGREDLCTGTLWNSTSGWGFLHGGHTDETKARIKESSKRYWEGLSEADRQTHVMRAASAPNAGRFVKGRKAPNAGVIGAQGKNWKLLNTATGVFYTFFNRAVFIKANPEFAFVDGMAKDHDYQWGKRAGWYLTEVTP